MISESDAKKFEEMAKQAHAVWVLTKVPPSLGREPTAQELRTLGVVPWMAAAMWAHARSQARIAELEGALKFILEKTETDPAEGPELRARAACVYQSARKVLGGGDVKLIGSLVILVMMIWIFAFGVAILAEHLP